ncbi:glycosyltransferase family 4 protein [Microbacterium trichothecenolyticum]|uniref:Glycosyltransferase involved in cell wall biosynthesis n=1 Tax=Microbacterium trichothecenolyticum TaxID=69370 RepID=A0ABU0TU94_MICTR|nr:glycosyltransferase family 4 protein [Microbacterium trichothecenolyticum]MDQ1123235.1 glycosyltransferase involved in cell wall biosynthesis [Microbacterium trichothecenolyticum]
MSQWRVLQVGPDLTDIGGMETVLRTYAQASWSEILVDVVASTTTKGPKARAKAFISALGKLRRGHYDVVHVHLSQRGSFLREGALALLTPRGSVRVATLHGSSFTTSATAPLWRHLYAFVLRRVDGIGVLNDVALAAAQELSPRTPVLLLPNPGPFVARSDRRRRSTPPVFFFAGKVGLRKGIDTLLAAWARVERVRPGAAHLHIAGPLDLPPHVSTTQLQRHYLGALDPADVAKHLTTATAAVLPSTGEGQPMFLIEALSTGTPMIVTDVGGMPGLAEGCGEVVPVGDPDALADAIVRTIDSPAHVEQWSAEAVGKYARLFSHATHEERLLALYDRALSAHSSPREAARP